MKDKKKGLFFYGLAIFGIASVLLIILELLWNLIIVVVEHSEELIKAISDIIGMCTPLVFYRILLVIGVIVFIYTMSKIMSEE